MKERKVAPRLFVIFAKEAHEAVIFARGPSSWFHVIRWDTKNDRFYPGAWIKGRIYPERCDLSPDGELLLYFIHQGRKLGTSYTDAWTAISRSPWVDVIGLWPQGTTYGGGGRFIIKPANIDDIRYCSLDSFASVALIVPSIVEGVDIESCPIMHFKDTNDQMRGRLLA